MKNYLKKLMKQKSTYKGLALVGAGAAAAAGNPDLLTASITGAGVSYGGIIGAAVPFVMGLWETLRNEFK